jgi:hypothetical protein
MSADVQTITKELNRVHRALAASRDRAEAVQRLRQVVDQAQRMLTNRPDPLPDRHTRHVYMALQGYVTLAEGSVRPHEAQS